MVNTSFLMEDVQLAASRTALLAALVMAGGKTHDIHAFRWKPQEIDRLASLSLIAPLERLNRIKRTSPEAFYNLYTAQNL